MYMNLLALVYAVICIQAVVVDTDLDYGSYRLLNLEKGLPAGVIDR
jgi:hypothetical protein